MDLEKLIAETITRIVEQKVEKALGQKVEKALEPKVNTDEVKIESVDRSDLEANAKSA